MAKSDISDREGGGSRLRKDAHAGLREVGAQTAAAGFDEGELYEFLVSSEEARIDFEQEQSEG